MKKDTPEDACDYENLMLKLTAEVTGVLFVSAVPLLFTHLLGLVSLTLIFPEDLTIVTLGLKSVMSSPLYVPPEADALSYAYPPTVLIVTVPDTTVADEAVIIFPRGMLRYISFELVIRQPNAHVEPEATVSPAFITPSVVSASPIVLLPILPLFAYRNWPFVSDVGVPEPMLGTWAIR